MFRTMNPIVPLDKTTGHINAMTRENELVHGEYPVPCDSTRF